tara:strand:- start:6343 stop:6537 length:195 start_codon:yes stop_codon:yes gene_type:complete
MNIQRNIIRIVPIKIFDEKVYFRSLISKEIKKGFEKIRLTIISKKISCITNIINLNINLSYVMY